jgi:hypothetical protein
VAIEGLQDTSKAGIDGSPGAAYDPMADMRSIILAGWKWWLNAGRPDGNRLSQGCALKGAFRGLRRLTKPIHMNSL